jgi:hypothetical protein
MTRCSRSLTFAVLSVLWCGVSAQAETMRCQSINGNVNCAGSGAVSCQTINGKKVCVSGHGDVVQSFGGGSQDQSATPDDSAGDDEGLDGAPPAPPAKQRLERRDPSGHSMLIERDGTQLHIRSDWVSVDRN